MPHWGGGGKGWEWFGHGPAETLMASSIPADIMSFSCLGSLVLVLYTAIQVLILSIYKFFWPFLFAKVGIRPVLTELWLLPILCLPSWTLESLPKTKFTGTWILGPSFQTRFLESELFIGTLLGVKIQLRVESRFSGRKFVWISLAEYPYFTKLWIGPVLWIWEINLSITSKTMEVTVFQSGENLNGFCTWFQAPLPL